MSIHAAIARLKKRLAGAQAERDGWQASGNEKNYVAAGYMVEALRLQLQRLELAEKTRAE